jgi:hypothetical protein
MAKRMGAKTIRQDPGHRWRGRSVSTFHRDAADRDRRPAAHHSGDGSARLAPVADGLAREALVGKMKKDSYLNEGPQHTADHSSFFYIGTIRSQSPTYSKCAVVRCALWLAKAVLSKMQG